MSLALLSATSCSDGRERNVIIGGSLFLEEHFRYHPQEIDQIVSAARRFALANQMDFLLARQDLSDGDFNATAAGRDLNLKVMHSGAVDGRDATIFAVARKKPSDADLKKAREFACAVGGSCR